MSGDAQPSGAYRVPTYKAQAGAVFYHFLHGHVPNHQIDFIYRPDIPQGVLTQQHFSHLSRLMKYIEPQAHHPFAFAIGNLSRDDTQHEPGHGGVGIIFSMRVSGVTDHAGRTDPTFGHGAAMINRHLDEGNLYEALTSFYSHLFGRSEDKSSSAMMYREYVRHASRDLASGLPVLRSYVNEFDDLPKPASSAVSWRWAANEAAQPKRVVIVHPNQIRFRYVARCAARMAAMLYASNIRWTSITNGREADLENGITIRLVPEAEAGAYTSGAHVLSLEQFPGDEEAIAQKIFGAKAVDRASRAAPVRGWRERYEAERGLSGGEVVEEAREGGVALAMPDSGPRRDQRVMRDVPSSPAGPSVERREEREAGEWVVGAEKGVPSALLPPVAPVVENGKGELKEGLEGRGGGVRERAWGGRWWLLALGAMVVGGGLIWVLKSWEVGKKVDGVDGGGAAATVVLKPDGGVVVQEPLTGSAELPRPVPTVPAVGAEPGSKPEGKPKKGGKGIAVKTTTSAPIVDMPYQEVPLPPAISHSPSPPLSSAPASNPSPTPPVAPRPTVTDPVLGAPAPSNL